MIFEDLVTSECILHVIDDSGTDEELVVNANVAFSYEVFGICAERVRRRMHEVTPELREKHELAANVQMAQIFQLQIGQTH